MRSTRVVLWLVVFGAVWLVTADAPAQQVTIQTPFHSTSDGFFERMGVGWSGNWKGVNFSFGGANLAVPQFGGYDPGAGLTTGFSMRGKDYNANFNIYAQQGYRQSFVTETPSVTLMNGQQAFISDTSQSPFVISQIPVVGGHSGMGYGYPMMGYGYPGYSMGGPVQAMPITNPYNPRVQAMRQQMANQQRGRSSALRRLAEAAAKAPRPRKEEDDLDLAETAPAPAKPAGPAQRVATAQSSSAGRAVPSVAEARRLFAVEQGTANSEAMALFERAQTAEERGKPGVAKVYYHMVTRRATGKLRERAKARLAALNSPGAP